MFQEIEMASPPQQSGLNLPQELCLKIIYYVVTDSTTYSSRQLTLKALRLVDKAFCICATPELFKSITIRFCGHTSSIRPWVPDGIWSLAMSERRVFVKEICLRDRNPYEKPPCSFPWTSVMGNGILEDPESDAEKLEIKEVDYPKSRVYKELPELLSFFPNVTFFEAHMWHSRPLNELFSNLSRPLKEALCSWLRADTPQNLTTVYVTDERQAAVFSPLFKRPYQFRAITEITRSAEEGNKQIISPDQLDCAFMELKLEHDSEFESWDRFQAFCMPPGVRVRMQISDFEEDAYEAGEDYDGFDDYSGLSTTWGARPLHGHSLMAALFPPADIMDIDGHQ